jgi:hypothetical protein
MSGQPDDSCLQPMDAAAAADIYEIIVESDAGDVEVQALMT